MPNQLILPPIPPGCGSCSGSNKYNSQITSGQCDFSPATPFNPPGGTPLNLQPVNPPGYQPPGGPWQPGQPNPVSPTSIRPIGPSTVPPIVGQFDPIYLNPPNLLPLEGQPSFPNVNPFTKPCPRYDNPNPLMPVRRTPQTPSPMNPANGPCTGGNNWNTTNSSWQPIMSLCASGMLICEPPPNPPMPFLQPTYVPPILQSGKRRSSTQPDDLCTPQ